MHSLILRTTTRLIFPLMLLYSLNLLWRGHNAPGGGFVGGLVAAAGFILYSLAIDVAAARARLWVHPRTLIGVGLLLTLGSATLSLCFGAPLMTGMWWHVTVPLLGALDLGTPFLFDVGVYAIVVGVSVLIIFSLAEET